MTLDAESAADRADRDRSLGVIRFFQTDTLGAEASISATGTNDALTTDSRRGLDRRKDDGLLGFSAAAGCFLLLLFFAVNGEAIVLWDATEGDTFRGLD